MVAGSVTKSHASIKASKRSSMGMAEQQSPLVNDFNRKLAAHSSFKVKRVLKKQPSVDTTAKKLKSEYYQERLEEEVSHSKTSSIMSNSN